MGEVTVQHFHISTVQQFNTIICYQFTSQSRKIRTKSFTRENKGYNTVTCNTLSRVHGVVPWEGLSYSSVQSDVVPTILRRPGRDTGRRGPLLGRPAASHLGGTG